MTKYRKTVVIIAVCAVIAILCFMAQDMFSSLVQSGTCILVATMGCPPKWIGPAIVWVLGAIAISAIAYIGRDWIRDEISD